MKKIFASALLVIAVASSAFASGETKGSVILPSNFKFEFKKASDLGWTENKEFTKASYILNNKKMEVFYSLDGELIGTALNINFDELPANSKEAFARKYQGYTVKEVIRFEGTDEAAYYISAVNEKESVYLKVDDNCNLSLFKTTKK